MYLRLGLLLLYLYGSDVKAGNASSDREDRVTKLEEVTSLLTRQLMLQQQYTEEVARSAGDSGIKQVRMRRDGTKAYFTDTHTSRSVAAMHEHSDHVRTCGMGELEAVLNGVQFRTRHNDYQLRMPSAHSGGYHDTEDIPFPEVPPAVLQETSLHDQMVEMRKWFKAWRDGDHSVRDYRKYFKPVLCYLEGAWTSDVALQEPFHSDRHHLEAGSWRQLQDQSRFTSYTGDKNYRENFAYLPSTILNVTAEGHPELAHWTYRILCHPVQGGFKLTYFHPLDNLASRLSTSRTFDQHVQSRAARFAVHPFHSDQEYSWSRLDTLMQQVPGLDNYGGQLRDSVFGLDKLDPRTDRPLNTAFYHRWYKVHKKDAMGEQVVHRGFADRNLFVAETSQPRVAAMSLRDCQTSHQDRTGDNSGRHCNTVVKRVSYAVPLELVFLTPLHTWNPYNIVHKGDARSPAGRTVREGGRSGKMTARRAFNGTNSRSFYRTPLEFFTGQEVHRGSADTTRDSVGVLDQSGTVRAVKASGVRIFLPEIHDVGVLRTRYPVMPVYEEGDPVWKELEALREVVLDTQRYLRNLHGARPHSGILKKDGGDSPLTLKHLQSPLQDSAVLRAVEKKGVDIPLPLKHLQSPVQDSAVLEALAEEGCGRGRDGGGSRSGGRSGGGGGAPTVLVTSPSLSQSVGLHAHTVRLSEEDMQRLVVDKHSVTLDTTESNGHAHRLVLHYEEGKGGAGTGTGTGGGVFRAVSCDGRARCFDGHSSLLQVQGGGRVAVP